jgi:PAS domain S-box-containing protein
MRWTPSRAATGPPSRVSPSRFRNLALAPADLSGSETALHAVPRRTPVVKYGSIATAGPRGRWTVRSVGESGGKPEGETSPPKQAHAIAASGLTRGDALLSQIALDCIISMDHHGRIVEFNPAAERTFGYTRAEAIGRDLADLIIPPALRQRHRDGMEHYLRTGQGPVLNTRIEMPALRADGEEIFCELAIARLPTDGPPMFTAYLRDISHRVRLEKYRSARLRVTEVLARATSWTEAAAGLLGEICTRLSWECGYCWIPDETGQRLRCLGGWSSVATGEFDASTRAARFEKGQGLPGRVWETGDCEWLVDVQTSSAFPRALSAAQAGLHGGFACPVVVGKEVRGVIEFYSQQARQPDEDLLETLTAIAGQLGQVMDRMRAEQELLQSEMRTRTILESITDGFWAVDRDWNFIYVNRKAEELLQRSRDELLGKNIWTEFAPASGSKFENALRQAVREGVPVAFHDYHPAQDRWYETHAYPSPDGLSVYFRDDSERRKAREALMESEQKFRFMAENIPQLAWMARPDGHIFWYNKRWYEYTGSTLEQMEGWAWQSVHDPAELPDVMERWQRSIDNGVPFDMVFPLRGADGVYRSFLTRVNPLRDEEGHILYWFGTNTDISELKKMEDALRDADRRKDEFLATLAHELRNPLSPIQNSLQILKMTNVGADITERSTAVIDRQVQQLVRLVDDLLDVSRVMRGKIDLRLENVELASVVARALETTQPLIDLHGHAVVSNISPGSMPLRADPVRLVQVVGNLLANAAKYTEPGGRIVISGQREGSHAILRVSDNGIGIAREMVPQIFDLFVQAQPTSARTKGGLGVGLTLVRNLVKLHGGTIEAFSEGLGEGSEFVVKLPLSDAACDGAAAGREPGGERPVVAGQRLLVVDDNMDSAESLAALLRLHGNDVRVAFSGREGLEIATQWQPRLIFLDIGMPEMDGYETARAIRAELSPAETVLVALTGWGQDSDRRRSSEAGFDHHLVKPADWNSIRTLLAAVAVAPTKPAG